MLIAHMHPVQFMKIFVIEQWQCQTVSNLLLLNCQSVYMLLHYSFETDCGLNIYLLDCPTRKTYTNWLGYHLWLCITKLFPHINLYINTIWHRKVYIYIEWQMRWCTYVVASLLIQSCILSTCYEATNRPQSFCMYLVFSSNKHLPEHGSQVQMDAILRPPVWKLLPIHTVAMIID